MLIISSCFLFDLTMAGSGDRDSSQESNNSRSYSISTAEKRQYEDDNPFIAFRRYADEQLSSFLHSFIGLPSFITPPSARDWILFDQADNPNTLNRRQGADEEKMQDTDFSSSSRQRRNETRDFAPAPTFPFHTLEPEFDDFWAFEPSLLGGFPFGSSPFMLDFSSSSSSAGWPIPYLLFSPYSPLHLERQQQLRSRSNEGIFFFIFSSLEPADAVQRHPEGSRWREAFEDLLRIENGKPMLENNSEVVKKEDSARDWLAGMIDRGSLGDQWKFVRRDNGGHGDYLSFKWDNSERADGNRVSDPHAGGNNPDSNEDDSFTELDLYDAFLHRANEPSANEHGSWSMSPVLNAILEEQRKQRSELQEHRKRWESFTFEGWDNQGGFGLEKSHSASGQAESPFNNAGNVGSRKELQSSLTPQSEPYVVSTTTSTNSHALPDGSTESKVVRTKRFSDGREESNETVHVTPATKSKSQGFNGSEEPGDKVSEEKTKRKSGWFWSD